MSFLETNTKFNIHNKRAHSSFKEDDFFRWSNRHIYRTSYNDMRTGKKCHKRQSCSIPGYAGYRPQIAANTHIGKTITEQSRAVFDNEVLDKQPNMYATTGFNASLIPQNDCTREARSRRYGTETWHFPDPAHHPANYKDTTTRTSFYNPKVHAKPNLRDRDPVKAFDSS